MFMLYRKLLKIYKVGNTHCKLENDDSPDDPCLCVEKERPSTIPSSEVGDHPCHAGKTRTRPHSTHCSKDHPRLREENCATAAGRL